jgi:sugar-specific transcriptional regulator TrmB
MILKQAEQTAQVMRNFGFTDPEVEIYLAVLTLEKATVSQISSMTHRSRTAIYFHVKNLLERGIIKETRQKTKLSLVALPPEELSKLFERWSVDFKSLVPNLAALKTIAGETPTFRVTDSKVGYLELYDEISSLPEKSMFRVLEGETALAGEMNALGYEQWKKFFQRIVDRKIETKALFTEESQAIPRKKLDPELIRIARERVWHTRIILESDLPFKNLLILYGNKAAFVFPQTSLVLILEHPGIVSALSIMFDTLFMMGRPGAIV